MTEEKVGEISHYFAKVEVAALKITDGELKVGDTIHIKGHTSDFEQQIESMQVEHEKVDVARPGDDIGIKVVEHAREGDTVYKILPE